MNLFPAVNHLKPFEYLSDYVSYHSLAYILAIVLNKKVQRATVHVLYEHKESVLVEISKIMSNDVFRLAVFHNSYLYFYLLQKIIVLNRNYPDSIVLRWVSKTKRLVDLTGSSPLR